MYLQSINITLDNNKPIQSYHLAQYDHKTPATHLHCILSKYFSGHSAIEILLIMLSNQLVIEP
jgi:hypothetical protein